MYEATLVPDSPWKRSPRFAKHFTNFLWVITWGALVLGLTDPLYWKVAIAITAAQALVVLSLVNFKPLVFPAQLRIAYVVWLDDETSAVDVLDLDTMQDRRVLISRGRAYGTAWTRDGRSILFNSDSDGDQEIYRADVTGGEVWKLTDNDAPDHLPVASSTRDEIIFTSERDGRERVYVMDLTTRETRLVNVR